MWEPYCGILRPAIVQYLSVNRPAYFSLDPTKLGMWKPLNIPAPALFPKGTNMPTNGCN